MEYNIYTGRKSNGEFTIAYQDSGYGAVIPVIDGTAHPELMMAYVSDADRDAGMKLLEEALKATGGNIPQAMNYMYNAAMTTAKGICADEAAMIDDKEVIIDYKTRKIYYHDSEIADMDDISTDLSNEAVKAILIERAKNNMPEDEDPDWDEDLDWDEDPDWDEDHDWDGSSDWDEDEEDSEDGETEEDTPEGCDQEDSDSKNNAESAKKCRYLLGKYCILGKSNILYASECAGTADNHNPGCTLFNDR